MWKKIILKIQSQYFLLHPFEYWYQSFVFIFSFLYPFFKYFQDINKMFSCLSPNQTKFQTEFLINERMPERKPVCSMFICRRWTSTWGVCCITESWRSSKAGEFLRFLPKWATRTDWFSSLTSQFGIAICFNFDWTRNINKIVLPLIQGFGSNLFGSSGTCCAWARVYYCYRESGYRGSCPNCGTYI